MVNVRLLKSKMVLHDDTPDILAGVLGVHRATMFAKMRGDAEFYVRDIMTIKNRYNLSAEDVDAIFFAPEVSKQ
jgi:hypothetical protein